MHDLVKIVQDSFEDIKINDEDGFEFWSARDLMKALGYIKWQKFIGVIEKAKVSCENSNQNAEKHFLPEPVKTSKAGGRPKENFLLTRYACYLIAQNGDSRKMEISLAQSYFASQTRKLELAEQEIEDNKRLVARKKLKESESEIEKTIYTRGIRLPVEFATFKNKGIEALYGLSVKKMKEKRGIPEKRALADFDNEVELKAKDFIYAMTDHNIKENKIKGKNNLEDELIENSKETRKTLVNRGINPEKLKKKEDLKMIEKRRKMKNIGNEKIEEIEKN